MALSLTKLFDYAADVSMANLRSKTTRELADTGLGLNDVWGQRIESDLATLNSGEATYNGRGTLTTDVDGDLFHDATGNFSAITDYDLKIINALDADVAKTLDEFYDFVTITGDITTASLVALETLTEGTSGATAKLFLADNLTVGTGRTVVMRVLTGTANGNKVWSGASGEITATAIPAAESRYIGGRVFIASTGLILASTAISVSARVVGTAV